MSEYWLGDPISNEKAMKSFLAEFLIISETSWYDPKKLVSINLLEEKVKKFFGDKDGFN